MDFSHLSQQLSSSPATALPLLFLAGVLTSLTPCIYPMIPITAALVGGQTAGETGIPRRIFIVRVCDKLLGTTPIGTLTATW